MPDKREPTFSVPDWVKIPACLRSSIAARKAGDPSQFPYRVTSSLHFSNGGGVYLADPKAGGDQVVLKEARPHAGLDRAQIDAVARLRREHEVLDALAGVPGVPRAFEHFTVWEHHYLAMEYMPGTSLGNWLARNYPLTRRDTTEADLTAYAARALAVLARVEETIEAIHARGFVFGDLHALNILIDEDDESRVSLIDFEMASDVESGERPALGAPGFRAPADRTGFEIDEHALAALRLWIFLPLSALLELAPAKLRGIADFVERRFGLPEGYADAAVAVLASRDKPRGAGTGSHGARPGETGLVAGPQADRRGDPGQRDARAPGPAVPRRHRAVPGRRRLFRCRCRGRAARPRRHRRRPVPRARALADRLGPP